MERALLITLSNASTVTEDWNTGATDAFDIEFNYATASVLDLR